MRGAIVDEDDGGGEGKRPPDDLDAQDGAEGHPDHDAGGLVRWREGGRDEGEVGR